MYLARPRRGSKCCWCIRAGRSGPRRIWAPGRSRKANTPRAKSRLPSRCANSRRKPARARSGDFLPLGERRSARPQDRDGVGGGRRFRRRHAQVQHCSSWNGRRKADASTSFPEVDRAAWFSIAEARGKKFFAGKAPSSTGCWRARRRIARLPTSPSHLPHDREPAAQRVRLLDEQPRGDARGARRHARPCARRSPGRNRERQRDNGWCAPVRLSSMSRSWCLPSRSRSRCASPVHILVKRGHSGSMMSI